MKPPLKITLLKGLHNVIDSTWQKFFKKVIVTDENNSFSGDNTFGTGTTTTVNDLTVNGAITGGGSEIAPTVVAGWSNGTGGYYQKRADNTVIVHMYCSGSGTATDGTTIFTLPSGYRPTNQYHCAMAANNSGWSYAGLMYITPAGAVKIYGVSGISPSEITALAVFEAA